MESFFLGETDWLFAVGLHGRPHPFAENIDTAEDLEWILWAMHRVYAAQFIQGATAIYLNLRTLVHMFRKGWLEVRRTRVLLPSSRKRPFAAVAS